MQSDTIKNGHQRAPHRFLLEGCGYTEISGSIETVAPAHGLDAIVPTPNCDKIMPGMLMADARFDPPAIVVSGGPMPAGDHPLESGRETLGPAGCDSPNYPELPWMLCHHGIFGRQGVMIAPRNSKME